MSEDNVQTSVNLRVSEQIISKWPESENIQIKKQMK